MWMLVYSPGGGVGGKYVKEASTIEQEGTWKQYRKESDAKWYNSILIPSRIVKVNNRLSDIKFEVDLGGSKK